MIGKRMMIKTEREGKGGRMSKLASGETQTDDDDDEGEGETLAVMPFHYCCIELCLYLEGG